MGEIKILNKCVLPSFVISLIFLQFWTPLFLLFITLKKLVTSYDDNYIILRIKIYVL